MRTPGWDPQQGLKERRETIAEKGKELANEMIAHADPLRVVRKAASKKEKGS